MSLLASTFERLDSRKASSIILLLSDETPFSGMEIVSPASDVNTEEDSETEF